MWAGGTRKTGFRNKHAWVDICLKKTCFRGCAFKSVEIMSVQQPARSTAVSCVEPVSTSEIGPRMAPSYVPSVETEHSLLHGRYDVDSACWHALIQTWGWRHITVNTLPSTAFVFSNSPSS